MQYHGASYASEFGTEILFGPGLPEEMIVISKKTYNLIFKELKEKKSHAVLYPIA